jgi:hypothetical protein
LMSAPSLRNYRVLSVKMRYEIKIVCWLYARWDLILELSV